MPAPIDALRPESFAGGFARDNGGVVFYTRVNALLRDDMTVVDLGAGRGTVFHSGTFGFYERLAKLQGKVKRVIGVDVDSAINEHPFLDERHIIAADGTLPIEDQKVDMVVSDWVFEHVQDPDRFAEELYRILKPGGWLCARTPNRWGYVGIGARLIPNRLHVSLLRRLSPGRHDVDVFPVAYKLNTPSSLRRYFPETHWDHFTFTSNPTPKYYGRSKFIFNIIQAYQNIAPEALKTDLIVLLRRKI